MYLSHFHPAAQERLSLSADLTLTPHLHLLLWFPCLLLNTAQALDQHNSALWSPSTLVVFQKSPACKYSRIQPLQETTELNKAHKADQVWKERRMMEQGIWFMCPFGLTGAGNLEDLTQFHDSDLKVMNQLTTCLF